MKITQYRNDGKTQTQRILEFETAVDAMRTEVSSRPVSNPEDMYFSTQWPAKIFRR